MSVLKDLHPRRVFEIFEEICAIPHGSGNTDALAQYCLDFAAERNLTAWKDEGGNVVIRKPAAPGYENAEPVIIQGHLDMVTEKSADCDIDFAKDGLRLRVNGDWVSAEGTTLGGDDGIAVAMGLAILDEKDAGHPELEILLTRDEETGMYGALELEGDKIRGRRLVNIDSENEGVFTVSCAGGIHVQCDWDTESVPAEGTVISVTIEGLTGGHSGVEIHHGRANACALMGRVLKDLNCRIVSLTGGGKANAIARQATAVVCVEAGWEEKIKVLEAKLQLQYRDTDPNFRIRAEKIAADRMMSEQSNLRCIAFLSQCPNGVVAMSEEIPGLVKTSLNLGILKATPEHFSALCSIRSSDENEKQKLADEIVKFAHNDAVLTDGYPAWEYKKDSGLRDTMVDVYEKMYGKKPTVEAIHAGLECGMLAGKLPGLDAVSIGPDMQDIHTPQERLSISSTGRVWEFLLEVLKSL